MTVSCKLMVLLLAGKLQSKPVWSRLASLMRQIPMPRDGAMNRSVLTRMRRQMHKVQDAPIQILTQKSMYEPHRRLVHMAMRRQMYRSLQIPLY